MKITVLGSGNAFTERNFNQCFLVEDSFLGETRRMLIDCGQTTMRALKYAGIDPKSITTIYISHAHADHIGSLEAMAFTRYDWKNRPQSYTEADDTSYAPQLVANEQLLQELWDKSLRGGLESMEGFVATMSSFFKPVPIKTNQAFHFCNWKCKLIQQVHIMTGSSIACTYGLLMEHSRQEEKHPVIYFTTDSQHCSPRQMEVFYQKADIIFQDCECTPFMSGVHANYAQLSGDPKANSVKLSDEIKKKMWLSHYQDFVLDNKDFYGNECDWNKKAEADGFAGFLKLGQVFEV